MNSFLINTMYIALKVELSPGGPGQLVKDSGAHLLPPRTLPLLHLQPLSSLFSNLFHGLWNIHC